MKKLQVKKSDIGRWVTVKWDDIGRIDSLLVKVESRYKNGLVFEPNDNNLVSIGLDQIIEKRDYIKAQ